MKKLLLMMAALVLSGCTGMPAGVTPVKEFDLNRYLGKWYEIARLDHSFERGLEQVSAEYSLNPNGSVKVVNRGYSTAKKKWSESVGKAKFVQGSSTGYLKVSFFGPFYGSYVVFELDKQGYQYAFVSGPDLSYLWLLSRNKTVSPEIKERFLQRAKEIGFDTNKLIFVKQ
ncbi:lipocalin family protein [Leucothrix pacifica]|uniref:Outer membrane lipoprotein Blc n=1 Tax=Leucothrix pacifica TaxID=1247513 RepID=A0A317C1S5_9GAMM|nr:lipocalin family protein [Leucothrix pacifica]PWQ92307.1 lipocalin [Leucothrix pacifica]